MLPRKGDLEVVIRSGLKNPHLQNFQEGNKDRRETNELIDLSRNLLINSTAKIALRRMSLTPLERRGRRVRGRKGQ